MTDIRIVDATGQDIPQLPTLPMQSDTVESYIPEELIQKDIASFMGITAKEAGLYNDNIRSLLSYARSQTTDHSLEGLKSVIRGVENKLGSPPFSEKRIGYVSRYVYLITQEAKLRKERQTIEGVANL
jgi:hypothetical protein